MIFCVEDDSSIRELMLYALQSAGFEGKGFPHGEALFQGLGAQVPDLILLDRSEEHTSELQSHLT